MASAKYKKIFEEIWNKNEKLFQEFFLLNNEYDDESRRKLIEEDFQKIGRKVQKLLQEGEQVLCGTVEKGSNSKFSTHLSEKYWDEVRRYFKYIDRVGVKTTF